MSKKELSKEELKNVLGGYLSEDAKSWYNRNYNEIYARVEAKSAYGDFSFIMEYMIVHPSAYSISEVKKMLKEKVGINVDDLN